MLLAYRNNSYRKEMFCCVYGVALFFMVVSGRCLWVAILMGNVVLFYAIYMYYFMCFTRTAIEEVRYSKDDFSRTLDSFLVEQADPVENHDCVICMEEFQETNKPVCIRCVCKENFYHRGCIREWLLKTATCPVCRFDLQSKV
jgi:hypothetical protein